MPSQREIERLRAVYRARFCSCVPGPPDRCLQDSEVVTQYGVAKRSSGFEFRSAPRIEGRVTEVDLSVLRGRLTAEEARDLVARNSKMPPAVRHATAGVLRRAGFWVVHTPLRGDPNHPHVSIVAMRPLITQSEIDGSVEHVPWTADEIDNLERCFNGPVGRVR